MYITNLPSDVDAEELHHVFSRCGVIAEEIDGQKPRIKLYMDDQGNFKGDALVMYFRAESVELAVQLLDDTQFRSVTPSLLPSIQRVICFHYKSKHTTADFGCWVP